MRRRIQKILGNLQAVGEDLLALSDDIWLSIEHNDSAALQRGYEFKKAYNQAVQEFDEVTGRLARLIEEFTEVPTFEAPTAEQSPERERERRERIIRSLDQRAPHFLDEEFRYKRPTAFKVKGVPFDGTWTWAQVYETFCRHLASVNPSAFEGLPSNPRFLSTHDKRYFSRDPSELRVPRDVGGGVFAETNLSADRIRESIKRLLEEFGLEMKQFEVYLREDRDATEEEVGGVPA